LKSITLVLCAIAALGVGAVAGAQDRSVQGAAAVGAVGTAQTTDETALAIDDATAAAPAAATFAGPNTLGYFLRMVLVLALVLGVVYIAYRLMRRLARPKASDDPAIRILASTSLGPGKAIHVIYIGSKAYLIGATDSTISLLSEIGEKETIDSLVLRAQTEPAGVRPTRVAAFGEMLGSLLGHRGRTPPARGRDGDFLARQRERLRKF
jgi:flagellar protein FliO/FliZ